MKFKTMVKMFLVLLIAVIAGMPVFADFVIEVAGEESVDGELPVDGELSEGKPAEEAVLTEETAGEEPPEGEPAEEAVLAEETAGEESPEGKPEGEPAEEAVLAEETAGEEPPEGKPEGEAEEAVLAEETTGEESISENHYLLESRRLAKLAEETYNYGDYDLAAQFAEESIWYAKMSDVYVTIATAKHNLDHAVSAGISEQHPAEYAEAESWYEKSIAARDEEELDSAIEFAQKTIDLLAAFSVDSPLPAAYTVRSWATSKDCFWNIAAYPWVYGNPHQWRVLYNANRSKLPNPGNPNLLEPGTVLEIPSIKGEIRQGAWEAGKTYQPLP